MKKLQILIIAFLILLSICALASMQAKAQTASISLSPNSGNFGSTVTVSGNGFAASSPITATFDGSPVTLSGPTTTDGSGNIQSDVTFTVPASTDGSQTVVVTDGSSNSGSATFTVTPSVTQYLVTFAQTGLNLADASGSLVSFTVSGGSYSGATSPIGVAGGSILVDSGASVSYSFANPVTSTNSGEQYKLSGVTDPNFVDTTPVTGASTVTGNYVTQYQVTFDASSNVKGDSSATIVTVNSAPYAESALPISLWVDSGSSVIYSFASPVTSTASPTDTRYRWDSTSGLDTLQSDTLTVSGAGTIIGNYKTQYYQTVTSSPATGSGYITVDGVAQATPYQAWWDSGSSHTIAANSPVTLVSGKSQYIYSSWSDSGAQSHLVSPTAVTTYTASFQLQYYLTVTGGNSPSGQGWYNSGASTTASSNWIWNTVAGQSRTAITNWQLDSTNQNPSRSNTGNLTTSSITMLTFHTVNFVSTTQYYLAVSGGNSISYGTASPTSDNWYDSGSSTTVSSSWVWGTVSGQSRTALTNWQLDGTNENPARADSGTLTTSSISFSAYHTVTFVSVTQYYLTVSGGNSITFGTTSPTGDQWYDSGTSTTVSSNGVYNRAGGLGTRVSSWNLDGGSNTNVATTGTVTTSSVSLSTYHTVNFNSVTQYQVTLDSGATSALSSITSPTISGDNYWYDSGTAVTLTLNGVYGRSGGSGTRISGYKINGGSNNPESTTDTFAVLNALSISSAQSITTITVTQYQVTLDSASTSALNSITSPTVSSDNYWYDSGTSVSVVLNGVWGRSDSVGNRLTGYVLNGGSNNPTSTVNTVTVFSGAISNHEFVTSTSVTQYFLTVSGGNGITYGTASTISGDTGWYDSGTSTTVSSNWVWGVSGSTRTALTNWNLNGGSNQNPTRANSGTLTTSLVTMSTANTVNFISTTQYLLTANGGNSITFGTASPTGDQWYDSGSSTTVSSNGIYNRASGTGTRVSSWNIDSGSSTNVATTGIVSTSSVSMSTYHTVNFNTVTQYQVTLDTGATSALSSITSPTISGDNYWYDSGTTVTVTLNGVYGRGSGTGTRITGYELNSGSNNPESTTGTFNAFSSAISNHEYVTTATVTQYQVTLDSGATLALISITTPTISGDNYWYDSGASVTLVLNGVYSRSGGSGTRISGYKINADSNNPESTTGAFVVLNALSISSAQSITTTTVTQFFLTVTGGNGITYGTAPTISGDTGWYDSGTSTTVSSNWVWNTVAGQSRTALTNYAIDSTNQNPTRSNTGTLTTSSISMTTFHTVAFASTTQYYLSVSEGNVVSYGTASPTSDNWYDSGSSTTVSSNWVWNVVSGQSRTAINNYAIDGSNQNPARQGSGTLTTSSIIMSTFHTVVFASTTQYYLMDTTISGSEYSITSSQTNDGWYDSGTNVYVVLNNVWGVSDGSRSNLVSYTVDTTTTLVSRSDSGTVSVPAITMSTPHSVSDAAQTQYQLTLSYSVSDGGSGYSAPSFTANQFGSPYGQTLTTSATGYWFDAGSSWTETNPLEGSGGTERWQTNQAVSGSVSSAQTLAFVYYHQYQVTFAVSPSGSGSTSPDGTNVWDAASFS